MHPDHENEQTGAPTRWCVTVKESALLLDVTIERTRTHIERMTLCKEKTPNGTVYIILDDYQTSLDGVHAFPDDRPYLYQTPETPALVEVLSQQIERLQVELDAYKNVPVHDRELEARIEGLRPQDQLLAVPIECISAIEGLEPLKKSPPITQTTTWLQKISSCGASAFRRRRCLRSRSRSG
jgi:hypothetical protein